MAHVVTMKTAPGDPSLVYLCTPPDMSATMGGFGPARYVGNHPPVIGASYVIEVSDLPRFRVYCANRAVRLVENDTPATRTRPPWAERPLPECKHCGQPVARGVNPSFCPNCGAPWEGLELGPSRERHDVPTRQCEACNAQTPNAYTHCMTCGAGDA